MPDMEKYSTEKEQKAAILAKYGTLDPRVHFINALLVGDDPEPNRRDARWWSIFTVVSSSIIAIIFGIIATIGYFILGGSSELSDRVIGGSMIGLSTAFIVTAMGFVWFMVVDE